MFYIVSFYLLFHFFLSIFSTFEKVLKNKFKYSILKNVIKKIDYLNLNIVIMFDTNVNINYNKNMECLPLINTSTWTAVINVCLIVKYIKEVT